MRFERSRALITHLVNSTQDLEELQFVNDLIQPHLKFMKKPLLFFSLIFLVHLICKAETAPVPAPVKPSNCPVSEFKSIGLTENSVELRTKRIESWIEKNGAQCSNDQLLLIYYNRGPWLGNADSPRIAGLIEKAMEAKNFEQANRMYQESTDKDGKKVLKDSK